MTHGRSERKGQGFLQIHLGDDQVWTMDGGSQVLENASALEQHGEDHRGEDVGIDTTDVVVTSRERTTLDPSQPAPNLLQPRHQTRPVLNITS